MALKLMFKSRNEQMKLEMKKGASICLVNGSVSISFKIHEKRPNMRAFAHSTTNHMGNYSRNVETLAIAVVAVSMHRRSTHEPLTVRWAHTNQSHRFSTLPFAGFTQHAVELQFLIRHIVEKMQLISWKERDETFTHSSRAQMAIYVNATRFMISL